MHDVLAREEAALSQPPSLLFSAASVFAPPNGGDAPFLKSARWSPCGSALLTLSDDDAVRVFDVPEAALTCEPEAPQRRENDSGRGAFDAVTTPAASLPASFALADSLVAALRVRPGEGCHDAAWWPGASSAQPHTLVFATTSRSLPLHVWSAIDGALRCSFVAYDAADAPTSAACLAFSPDGGSLLGGYSKAVLAFDVARPGRDAAWRAPVSGLVLSLAASPDATLFAAGCSSSRVVLLDARCAGSPVAELGGHGGGVTHARFSACGSYLYTGARRDDRILCWDVRSLCHGAVVALARPGDTNQRLGFSVHSSGRFLAAGGTDGRVRTFDLRCGAEVEAAGWRAGGAPVGWAEWHPFARLLATATGTRCFEARGCGGEGGGRAADSEDSEGDRGEGEGGARTEEAARPERGALRVWRWPAG